MLIEVGLLWEDDLTDLLVEKYGEAKGLKLADKYADAFPSSYREHVPASEALYDIKNIECLAQDKPLQLNLYRPGGERSEVIGFKVFRPQFTIPLSDVLPIFENLGLRVISENPYKICFKDGSCIWINDFSMVHESTVILDLATVKPLFEETFSKVWNGEAENDGFNRLVLSSCLNWREVSVMRAYAEFLRQA